ncbi:transglutaminase TgpA family protein [Hydrogenimonas sp.]
MASSPRWHATDAPRHKEALRLLDFAYLAVLPPLLLILKLPMLLFTALAVGLVFLKQRLSDTGLFLLFLIGAAAIFLSLYGAFNVVGLSRLKLFVELLVYLLLLAVTLQRLSGKVNLYLVLSPLLLLALSLFFYQSIPMLLYVVAEIFVLIWLAVTWYMRTSLSQSLRTAATLFALSLPLVVLLFIFFPRISFGHASFGFRGESAVRTSLDGTMRLDDGALGVLSRRIVMEVGFDGKLPPESRLYFRGSVLYLDKGDHWAPLPPFVPRRVEPTRVATSEMVDEQRDLVTYKISLYPTRKRWLYLLDLPVEAPEGALIDADFSVKLKKPIEKPQIYAGGSALRYRYGSRTEKEVLRYALAADPAKNPRCAEAAAKIAEKFPDEAERLKAVEAFFRQAGLTYTLKPDPLDLRHAADSFLFEKKKGFCVHFAGAFVTFCRLARLPARVVTGYKGSLANSVRNYVAVEERDAHAWAEVFVSGSWRRVETTAFAARIADDPATRALLEPAARREGGAAKKGETSTRVGLYLLYAKFKVETWILRYSRYRQMQLLEKAKNEPAFVLKFAASLLGMVLLVALAVRILKRPPCEDPARCLMAKAARYLAKAGCPRREHETVRRYLRRCAETLPELSKRLERLDALYHEARYGEEKKALEKLKKEVKELTRLKIRR